MISLYLLPSDHIYFFRLRNMFLNIFLLHLSSNLLMWFSLKLMLIDSTVNQSTNLMHFHSPWIYPEYIIPHCNQINYNQHCLESKMETTWMWFHRHQNFKSIFFSHNMYVMFMLLDSNFLLSEYPTIDMYIKLVFSF